MLGSIRSMSFNPFPKHDYKPVASPPTWNRWWIALKLAVGVFLCLSLGLFLFYLAEEHGYTAPHASPSADESPIPSIVHYVYIKKDPNAVVEFPFTHWLSLYASIMYLKPKQVFIHTDFNSTELDAAARNGSRWAQLVFDTFPDLVTWNQVRAPVFIGRNELKQFDTVQHKSDFIRWEQIAKTGGIYLDWDVIPLRDVTPLLKSGFSFIGGRQDSVKDDGSKKNATINNSVFMSQPNSAMAKIIVREQNAGGDWAYSPKFISTVAERLVSIPSQVLLCDRSAFAPTHGIAGSKDSLFSTNSGPPSLVPTEGKNSTDPVELYDIIVQNRRSRMDWEIDFSSTYMLDASGQEVYTQDITPKRILARTSNYGVVTWSIVSKMVSDRLIKGDETV